MLKNPIPKVSDKKQQRAIGIVFGRYNPFEPESINKGVIQDINGLNLEAVVLGKALPLIKKFVNFQKKYYWIVYPRNKNSDNFHLQIVGIWDPNNFEVNDDSYEETKHDLLRSLDLKDNFFSIRGKLIFINIPDKELIIKISPSKLRNGSKRKAFKISVKGIIPMKYINSFISIEATRKKNSLVMDNFEIIEEIAEGID